MTDGRPGRPPPALRRAVLLVAAAVAAGATVALAFAPYLVVEHPRLFVALAPDGANLALVSGRLGLGPLLLIALPMRVVGVLAAYGVGAIYGHAALLRLPSPRARRIVAGFERALDRLGAPLLVVLPAYSLGLVAGAAGLEQRRAVPAIVAGQVVAVAVLWRFGAALAPWTERLIGFLDEQLAVSTAICVAAVVGWRLWRRRRGVGGALAGPDTLPD